MTVSRKTLQIKGISDQISFKPNSYLLDILNANKVSISQSCGGFGSCTTCRVFILKGLDSCSTRSEIETERAEERTFADNERLACQTRVYDDLEIEITSAEQD